MQISPLLFILYDCIFNHFVITKVFYYLLFYVPMRLITRASQPFLNHAPYITNLLYDIYYKDENCLYACAPNIFFILKSFLLSGVVKNPDLGVQMQAEIFISATCRFELDKSLRDGTPNNVGLYINIDGEYLHSYDNIHFFHLLINENDEPIRDQEWIVFANKLSPQSLLQTNNTPLKENPKTTFFINKYSDTYE